MKSHGGSDQKGNDQRESIASSQYTRQQQMSEMLSKVFHVY
jgi:hypothetical protein